MVAWELFCKVRFFFLFSPLPESWALNVHHTSLVCFKAVTATERYIVHTVIDYFSGSTLASEQAANNGLDESAASVC